MTDDERSAAKTMDEVRDGMQAVIVLAMDRLRETEEALQAGDFGRASTRVNEGAARIAALAQAEGNLAIYAGKTIARGNQIAQGMEIIGAGLVTAVENVTDHSDECVDAIFQYTLDDGDVRRAYSDQEVLVARSGD